MNNVKIAARYLRFLSTAQTKYYVHSPFVYDFCETVLSDRRWFYAFSDIIGLRSRLEQDKSEIEIKDLGAGSAFNTTTRRSIRDLNRKVSTPDRDGKLLFRLVDRYQCQKILELGTCLGVGTCYLAKACAGEVWTIEGAERLAKRAQEHFQLMDIDNVRQVVGPFGRCLLPCLKEIGEVDLVFFDGNHQEDATLSYFETCLEFAHEGSIFVFDDIYWSEGMMRAWTKIKNHPSVRLSLDLFHLGICFFHEGQAKQDFKLYFF